MIPKEIEKKLNLSSFIELISRWFREIFSNDRYRIVAEISKIKQRHDKIYIEVLEYKDNQVIAKAHAIVMDMKIIRELKDKIWYDKLEQLNKLQILFLAKPIFHKDYGFQLDISYISAEYSIGSLKQKETNIRQQLSEMWIIANNKKLALSIPPYRICIISSETSEWLKDFLWVLDDSLYRYSYKLYPSAIHGNQANIQVHSTLQKVFMDVNSGIDHFDVLIILRWGGGSSGIMRHNDIGIAKGICYMPMPVIIAIWHKQDKYLLDDICYHSAITPSDAGHRIVDKYDKLKQYICTSIDNINITVKDRLLSYIKNITTILQDINHLAQNKLELYRYTIKNNHDIILSNNPMRLKSLWYGIIYDKNDNVLNKEKIYWLNKWDIINIKIYDKKIDVKIENIS